MSAAAAALRPGPPEVLELIDVPAPAPGPGEVRVRMRAAGVQPADLAVRGGWAPPGAELSYPQVPGNELAGVVDAVGPDVSAFAPGDAVIGFRTLGCYAELVVVPADQLVAKPAAAPWEEAGALSASGQTAHTALEDLALAPGETLLVHGAAGGVGTVAVQLARRHGATVIGSADPANHDYLRALGAVPVAYGDGLEERVRALAPSGVDAALDAAGHGSLAVSASLVADRARSGTLVDYEHAREHGARFLRTRRSAQRLAELAALHAGGDLRIHVRAAFPLARAADAHHLMEAGHGAGKIVLTAGPQDPLTPRH